MVSVFRSTHGDIDLSRPVVMGILNVTPDSFSDGGRFVDKNIALEQARSMIAEGAAIIDIGGESTRPGAQAVGLDEELSRVIPLIEMIRAESDIPISIDTSKPEIMRAAVKAGADMINDVYALRAEGAVETIAMLDVPVCLMHMQGEPRTMQQAPLYDDVVGEVVEFLQARLDACVTAGISPDRILIDPGIGFGKSVAHNLALMARLSRICDIGVPVLVGVSRKSMIGAILDNRPTAERLFGSVALAALAVSQGASIIRAHDVRATLDAIKLAYAVRQAGR